MFVRIILQPLLRHTFCPLKKGNPLRCPKATVRAQVILEILNMLTTFQCLWGPR